MTKVLGRRRLLLSAVAEGAGLDAMFRLMGRETGADCWLLTATGRVVGGTGPSLPGPLGLRLAGEYLKADRLPAAVRVGGPQIPAAGDGKYSLFGVGGEPRITSWFVACAGHEQEWGPAAHELRESVAELAADAALERARLEAGRAGDRKLAEAIVTMLASEAGEGPAPAEIASLMRTAGLPPEGPYLVAAMSAEADRMAGPNADRWRCDLAEELAVPYAEGAVVAPLGDQMVMLVPLPPGPGPGPGDQRAPQDGARAGRRSAAHAFAARLRGAQPVLECDRSRIRLTVGVSAPAPGVTALDGALHEAQSALRLAAIRAAAMGRPRRLGGDQRRGGLARAPAGQRARQRAAFLPRTAARPAAGLRRAAPGRAAAHPARVPGLLGLVERVCGRDVRARQHGAVPDQAHRGADRTRPFLAWTTRWISSSPCGFATFARVVVIRSASAADAAQIAAVMRDSWFAAYDGHHRARAHRPGHGTRWRCPDPPVVPDAALAAHDRGGHRETQPRNRGRHAGVPHRTASSATRPSGRNGTCWACPGPIR